VLFTCRGAAVVFHRRARTRRAQHAAGLDDVMAVADTGWGMLFARNAQEAQDLGLVPAPAENSRTPFPASGRFLTPHHRACS
jgi:pyruvate-ferredoxin/flavodoxin oxidoreductase